MVGSQKNVFREAHGDLAFMIAAWPNLNRVIEEGIKKAEEKARVLGQTSDYAARSWAGVAERLTKGRDAIKTIAESRQPETISFDAYNDASQLGDELGNFTTLSGASRLSKDFSKCAQKLEAAKNAIAVDHIRAALRAFKSKHGTDLSDSVNGSGGFLKRTLSGEGRAQLYQVMLEPLQDLEKTPDSVAFMRIFRMANKEGPAVMHMPYFLKKNALMAERSDPTIRSRFWQMESDFSKLLEKPMAELLHCRDYVRFNPQQQSMAI